MGQAGDLGRVRLSDDDALDRLVAAEHGVFCTVHPSRGVDAVPAVYAVDDDGWLGVPVDTVKAKSSTRLQRERNLEADPRATLLVEHWDRDHWSRLWWVRAELRHEAAPDLDVETASCPSTASVPTPGAKAAPASAWSAASPRPWRARSRSPARSARAPTSR